MKSISLSLKRKKALLWLLPLLLLLVVSFLFNVSKPGARVAGCLSDCSNPALVLPEHLRIISLNMLHGHGEPEYDHLRRRLDLISDEIQRQEADIVLMQEVPWTIETGNAAEYLAERVGMNHIYLRANGNRWVIFFEEGSAILSRYPIRVTDFSVLQPAAGFFENRIALHAVVEMPFGDLDVFVTHLTHRDTEVNRQQAAALLEYVQQRRSGLAIIGGDFNAGENSQQIRSLYLAGWVDSYRRANPTEDGFTCCINDLNTTGQLEKRIDYIFLAAEELPAYRLIDVKTIFDQPYRGSTDLQWVSDHIGLLVDLSVAP